MPPRKEGTSVHARKNIYFLSGFVCKGFSAWKGGKTAVPGAGKNERLLGYKTSSRRKCLVRSTSSVPSGPTVPAAKFFGELQIQTDESDDEKKLSPASADGPAGVAADRSCPIRPKTFIPLKEQIRQASGA